VKKEKLITIVCNKFDLNEKEASGYILSGSILVNEVIVTKKGLLIDTDKNVRIKQKDKYVSRGAYKLLTAFNNFNLSVHDKICIDIGSSTGGFTQVLLEKGASKVYSVDCGNNLLHYSLRSDKRVVIIENKKYSELQNSFFNEKIDLAVIDVSFTSVNKAIEFIYKNLNVNEIVALVKPQFEYERLKENLKLSNNFKGIVKDNNDLLLIINEIKKEINLIGLNVLNYIESEIKGTKGNTEYLFYIKR
jgi:23S rRNA (cytidine1920-2'-O)/16S rRNA (cytidine1409-2'-O)-methyltransferase